METNMRTQLTSTEEFADGLAIRESTVKFAKQLGIPVAYLYADNSDLAEVILAFSLLPEPEQRRLALELKARVSPPATKVRGGHRVPAARHER